MQFVGFVSHDRRTKVMMVLALLHILKIRWRYFELVINWYYRVRALCHAPPFLALLISKKMKKCC